MLAKVIKTLLDNSAALNALIPILSRYPYVINTDTDFPAMVYTINRVDPGYDKDGWVGDNCEFSIMTFTDNYTSLQDIVSEVRTALELKDGTVSDIDIEYIYLIDQEEGYNIEESCFINKLTFTVSITKY